MEAAERHPPVGGKRVMTEEPFFTEEAEVEARPVVPLARVGGAGRRARLGLSRNLMLVLAVVAAGAAGVTAGYLIHAQRSQAPAAETTTDAVAQPATTQTSSANDPSTSVGATEDTRPRPEPSAVEARESPAQQTVASRVRSAGERSAGERAARAPKEEARHEEVNDERPKRPREESDRDDAGRPDGAKHGKPKARLVGTITARPRP